MFGKSDGKRRKYSNNEHFEVWLIWYSAAFGSAVLAGGVLIGGLFSLADARL